jgi:hypothetical protein
MWKISKVGMCAFLAALEADDTTTAKCLNFNRRRLSPLDALANGPRLAPTFAYANSHELAATNLERVKRKKLRGRQPRQRLAGPPYLLQRCHRAVLDLEFTRLLPARVAAVVGLKEGPVHGAVSTLWSGTGVSRAQACNPTWTLVAISSRLRINACTRSTAPWLPRMPHTNSASFP